MNAQTIRVFNHHFLDQADTSIPDVVSAPIPMRGNSIRMTLNVYSVAGGAVNPPTITMQLEGSVLGETWEDITATSGLTTTSTIGGVRALYSGVSFGMVRVRVTVGGDDNDTKAWFDVGMTFTDQ